MGLKSFLWSLPLALIAVQAQAAGPAVDTAAVRALIVETDQPAAPGCAVSAFRDGRRILETSAGLADLDAGHPIDGGTLFYAASVSKQFTALAVAQLAVDGRIDLDADVRRYLPELPEYTHVVTPRMLMHHTAGVPDWLMLAAMSGIKDWGTLDRAQTLALIAARPDTAFVPGSRFVYSNGGYKLLAEIVSRTTGTPFAEHVRTHVFEPLGMRDAFFLDGMRPDGTAVAHGYVPVGDGFEVRDTYPLVSGSGGLMLSADDLARYEHDIEVGHRVWTDAVREIMWTPALLSDGSPAGVAGGLGYAGGLRIGVRKGQRVIEHAGAAEAFRLQYLRLPDRRLAVVVLCNRGDRNPVPIADAVAALLEGDGLWSDAASTFAGAGDYVDAALGLRYRVPAAVDDGRLRIRIVSPLTAEAGVDEDFSRDADGDFVADDPLRPIRVRFAPDGTAIDIAIGAHALRLLRETD